MKPINLIIGETGNLARALATNFLPDEVTNISRSIFGSWGSRGSDKIQSFFKNLNVLRVYVAAGITNPSSSPSDIQNINIDLPIEIAKVCSNLAIPVFTFGSIHENSQITNPYLESKRRLVDAFTQKNFETQIMHFQLHTLYGGKPIPHMFLGQMANSIVHNQPFGMSSGSQLREFHHCIDDAYAIKDISIRTKFDARFELSQLNSGKMLSLRDVAYSTFDHFNALNLLSLGEVKEIEGEIFVQPEIGRISPYFFRDGQEGIYQWIKEFQDECRKHIS